MTDPFNRLGIAPDSTADAIKRAYRTLAKQCHPDLREDKEAASAEFRELTKIYETALLMCGKSPPPKSKPAPRPPPSPPSSPLTCAIALGLIDDYEFTNFGAAFRFAKVPRVLMEYGGTVFAGYSLKRPSGQSQTKSFQFEIMPKTKSGQTLRFNMPIGIIEILLVPEG